MSNIGIYATAPRGATPDTMKYAKACLEQGKGYQTTAVITGVNECDLREFLPGYGQRRTVSVPEAPPYVRLTRILPTLSKGELARAVAMGAKMLEETAGKEAVKDAMRSAVPSILWEPRRFSLAPDEDQPKRGITGRDVVAWAAQRQGLTIAEMTSDRRDRPVARARQIAMFLVRQFCPHLSFPSIGRMLGGRDHTTILHGVAKVKELRDTDATFRANLDAICQEAADHFGVGASRLCEGYAKAVRAAG